MSNVLPPGVLQEKAPQTEVELVKAIGHHHKMAERSMAGYNHVVELVSQQNGTSSEARKRPLPVLEYKASLDGVNMVEICADLRKMAPADAEKALTALASLHATEMLESLSKIHEYSGQLYNVVLKAVTPQAPQAQPQPPQEEATQEYYPPEQPQHVPPQQPVQ